MWHSKQLENLIATQSFKALLKEELLNLDVYCLSIWTLLSFSNSCKLTTLACEKPFFLRSIPRTAKRSRIRWKHTLHSAKMHILQPVRSSVAYAVRQRSAKKTSYCKGAAPHDRTKKELIKESHFSASDTMLSLSVKAQIDHSVHVKLAFGKKEMKRTNGKHNQIQRNPEKNTQNEPFSYLQGEPSCPPCSELPLLHNWRAFMVLWKKITKVKGL